MKDIPDGDARAKFFAARPTDDCDLRVRIGTLVLQNPVMPASGCFGPELGRLIPVAELGATVTKTVFYDRRGGNLPHRITEVPGGMVNSVGIPSRGPDGYRSLLHTQYRDLGVPVIVSVGAHRPAEYASVISLLSGAGEAYELNVSCPNLDSDGIEIGADPQAISTAVLAAREVTDRPLIVKLSPMVPFIADCADAAQSAGADAVCVSNSVPALPVDRATRMPALGNVVGGLSGPAIKPIVLRLVWQAARAVRIPVIACGGIETAADALDYMRLGATAVQVGTASFARPFAAVEIVRGLRGHCVAAGASRLSDILAADAGPRRDQPSTGAPTVAPFPAR
ncbi:MAG TPA: dihydroorotate dehydrogenase [Trebonia sp.]|nr:dihydroorotate dehydrogenase [Trebonia sp.]